VKGIFQTLNPKENGNLPEYVNEQKDVGFSNLLRKDLTLLSSS